MKISAWYFLIICYSLVACNNTSTEKIKSPITFEQLINAYDKDSLSDFMEGRFKWQFKRYEGDSANNYFPVQIGNFIGELTSDKISFHFHTGDLSKALKKVAGDELEKYTKDVAYIEYSHFIDSLRKYHQVKDEQFDDQNRIKSILLVPTTTDVSLYSIDYKENQVKMSIMFPSVTHRKATAK